ncbi:LexA family protein [Streptomyces sp. NPDC001212]
MRGRGCGGGRGGRRGRYWVRHGNDPNSGQPPTQGRLALRLGQASIHRRGLKVIFWGCSASVPGWWLSDRAGEEIPRCIRRWIEDRGKGPSARRFAHAVGMRSTASVAHHLADLERSGALVRDGRGWNTCSLGSRRGCCRGPGRAAIRAGMDRPACRRAGVSMAEWRVRFRCGVAMS